MRFFPDKLPKGRQVDRGYFYNILNTLYPEYVEALIAKANNSRYAAEAGSEAAETITVSQEWWERLNSVPYVSRKSFTNFNSS